MSYLILTLNSTQSKSIHVRKSYQHQLQSMIYQLPSAKYADFLHNTGFSPTQKKDIKYKMFAFSRLMSHSIPLSRNQEKVEFALPVKFVVSSPLNEIIEEMQTGALLSENLRIGNNHLYCVEANIKDAPETDSVEVKTLSPILCYSKRADGYKEYLSPYQEADFNRVINKILKKKYLAVYKKDFTDFTDREMKIVPSGIVRGQTSRFYYDDKNFLSTKVWSGKFRITGPKELIEFALSCGLGEQNSAGYGCVYPTEYRI